MQATPEPGESKNHSTVRQQSRHLAHAAHVQRGFVTWCDTMHAHTSKPTSTQPGSHSREPRMREGKTKTGHGRGASGAGAEVENSHGEDENVSKDVVLFE